MQIIKNASTNVNIHARVNGNYAKKSISAKSILISAKTISVSTKIMSNKIHARVNENENCKTKSISAKPISPKSSTPKINTIFLELLKLYPQLHVQLRHAYLLELLQYLQTDGIITYWLTDDCVPAVLEIITTSLFRSFPSDMSHNYDATQDKSWLYLQVVYDILQRFVTAASVQILQKYIDQTFICQMVQLLSSPNYYERLFLKQILHTMYTRGTFVRHVIRKQINNCFYSVIYFNLTKVAVPSYYVADLLEILSHIINTLTLPLQAENISLLNQILIPMHKVSFLCQFHKQLSYCIMQFIQKDVTLTSAIITGLLKYWPVRSAEKEILFLNELEQILKLMDTAQLAGKGTNNNNKLMIAVFKQIAESMSSANAKVCESALLVWSDVKMIEFISEHRIHLFPILYPTLQNNYFHHWNSVISTYTLKMTAKFNELDTQLLKEVHEQYVMNQQHEITKNRTRALKWTAIRKMATQNTSN